jgi:two-component system sensor histidine kinase CssS
MKKLNFTFQLLIVFAIALTFGIGLFFLLVTPTLDRQTVDITFSRLDSYVEITKKNWINKEEPLIVDGFDVGYLVGSSTNPDIEMNNLILEKSYYNNYLTKDLIFDFLETVKKNPKGNYKINNTTLHYIYRRDMHRNDRLGEPFIIVFIDDSYGDALSFEIGENMLIIFILILLVATVAVGVWGGYYINRVNRLNKHVSIMEKNHYKIEYSDGGRDELGKLSDSVEILRLQILKNEETKQEMLQNLSHDFKTPIAVIRNYAEAITDGMADKEEAEIISKQATVLQRKVNKLLQYNKLEYLSHDKEFEEINMKELIDNVITNYKFNTKISYETSLDDTKFIGYKENFYTVVENILDNASRYARKKIKITLKDGILKIYNDGEHIDEVFLNSNFKPYEKGSKGEFGLGMSIVVKTLFFFGYEIGVKNELVGVTFTIKKRDEKNI